MIDIRSELRSGTRKQGSRLRPADLGRTLSLEGFGQVAAYDIGKRVWHRPWGLLMQSAEQRDADMAHAELGIVHPDDCGLVLDTHDNLPGQTLGTTVANLLLHGQVRFNPETP